MPTLLLRNGEDTLKTILIDSSAAMAVGDKVIGFDSLSGCFFELSLANNEIVFFEDFFIGNDKECFGYPYLYENQIYFPPCNSKKIITISDEMAQYEISSYSSIPHRFSNIYIQENKAFLLPGCGRGIVLFNLKTGKEKKISAWITDYEKKAFMGKIPSMYGKSRYGSYLILDNEMLFPLLHASMLLKINIKTLETELIEIIGGDSTGLLAVYGNKEHQFVLTRTTKELVKIKNNKIINRYKLSMDGTCPGRSLMCGEKIFVLGRDKAILTCFDIKLEKETEIQLPEIAGATGKVDFGSFIRINNGFLITENNTGKIIIGKVENGQYDVREIHPTIREDSVIKILCKKMQKNQIVEENELFTLERFIQTI